MRSVLIFFMILLSTFGAKQKILIIGSYHNTFIWQSEYLRGIKSNLGDNYDYTIYEMDTKRIVPELFQSKASEAIKIYEKLKPDLVLVGDDNALLYTKEYFKDKPVPYVFLGINGNLRDYFVTRPNNFTGVLERPIYKRNVQFIKDCLPNIKKILILYDNSDLSEIIFSDYFESKAKSDILGVETNFLRTNNYSEWKKIILEESKLYDAVLIGVYATLRDDKGKPISDEEVITWTSKNIKKPIFSTWEYAVGKTKTIGGLVLSPYNQGYEAAEIVREILVNKVKPISIYPVTATKGEYIISKTQLNNWKLVIPLKYKSEIRFVD